ncbi:hypothetical protein V3391_06485 [Luteimonas sp. SMYT11W]|uniref:Curculin (Mannose-binding) lectin protein n=1 Tax=Luteimonas flava TaxID=3115822 RepID=A0ABU7WD19_9GAMM
MADEITLFRPQRLTDNPDGGGLATATEIVDGEVNNLFDDISRIDRVNGEVSLRKFFAIADTQDASLFSDLHVIVQEEPLDPRVSVVLFRTPGWGDVRSDAQSYVERYLDESVITRMIPYDRQLVGQRTVLVYQRPELSLPEIGQVYALKNDATGQREFIRVQDVKHQVESYTDDRGDFQARVITLEISQPLTQEFLGSQPNRFFAVDANRSVVRRTIASDAARYKGIVRLARDAPAGSLSVRVESVFAQLVPSATTEAPVVDARPEGSLVAMASGPVIRRSNANFSGVYFFETPVLPGSVYGAGPQNYVDRGDGRLRNEATGAIVGTIDYAQGRAEVNNTGWPFELSYRPAAHVSKVSNTWMSVVSIANRGYVYAPVLRPLPSPGTTTVAYRALGRWYQLADNGSGQIVGEAGTGSGLVNFQTGSAPVTLGALPDVGSAVVYSFGTTGEFEVRTGDVAVRLPAFQILVDGQTIEPGSLTVRWLAGATLRTATDNGAGVLQGAATGEVIYAAGEILLRPAVLPSSNAEFEVEYQEASSTVETHTPALVSGSITIALASPVRPGTLQLQTVGYGQSKAHRRMRDNGAGAILDSTGAAVLGAQVVYEEGIVILPGGVSGRVAMLEREAFAPGLPGRLPDDSGVFGPTARAVRTAKQYANQLIYVDWVNGTAVTVDYAAADAPVGNALESHGAGALALDLVPLVRNSIVPGGVLFDFAGRTYYDRSGTLYHSMSHTTGAGTAAGTIDYAAGTVALTSWAGGVAPSLALRTLLTEVAPLPMGIIHGRTPGAPLRPGTFTLVANRVADGQQILATADNNGNIDTADMHGWVDSNSGAFSVAFGRYVLDSTLTPEDKAQSWYNVADVDSEGYIWRPAEVIPSTVRFNCVVQVTVPVDPEIIKINPVRLPPDGRVPVVRRGDTLVVQDSQPYQLPGGLAAGQQVQLPRGQLASVAIYDQAGLGVRRDQYNLDAATGVLTMASPLDLAGYVQPLVAIHVVEDMALCLDAQITGEVQLGQALTHDYVADNATVSSAQILGDAQARYGSLFTQATWTNVWSDSIIGDPPASGARYNDALFPLDLTNADTITERWRLTFTSATTYNVVGEKLGLIASGDIFTDCAPINPATGQPYLTLRADGFGAGWGVGNTVRWNTFAAGGPLWAARTVLSGPATNTDDRVRIQARWDKD